MVRDCCLCLHVQRAARALARQFDEALRPFELTNGQFSLLMSLNRPEPPSMRPVAALLAMDRTTLTAALKPLEQRGLVKISPDPADRRSRILLLTVKGAGLLASAFCKALIASGRFPAAAWASPSALQIRASAGFNPAAF